VRVAADQSLGPRINRDMPDAEPVELELRVKGAPAIHCTGALDKVLPAGQEQLPSAALGYIAGGTLATKMDDPTQTTEPYFEVRIKPHVDEAATALQIGQRVVVRFTLPPKPLAVQWWRSLRQLLQQRFAVQM